MRVGVEVRVGGWGDRYVLFDFVVDALHGLDVFDIDYFI